MTSTWHVCTVRGSPCSARTSKQSLMASRTFVRACCLVSPWLTHPGIDGHSAIQMPSSSLSSVTMNFIQSTSLGYQQSLLRVPAREDARHEGEHVGGTLLIVPVVANQPPLDHVDLLLRRLVHHVGHQAGQLDRVLLVLEQLQFQCLLQALVGLVVELLAVDG